MFLHTPGIIFIFMHPDGIPETETSSAYDSKLFNGKWNYAVACIRWIIVTTNRGHTKCVLNWFDTTRFIVVAYDYVTLK